MIQKTCSFPSCMMGGSTCEREKECDERDRVCDDELPPPVPTAKVVELDSYRSIEEIVKQRLGATHVVFGAVLPDGQFMTFIPTEIYDMELVYLIKTFEDRRSQRLEQ